MLRHCAVSLIVFLFVSLLQVRVYQMYVLSCKNQVGATRSNVALVLAQCATALRWQDGEQSCVVCLNLGHHLRVVEGCAIKFGYHGQVQCSARAQSAECRVVSCEVEMGREGNNLLAQASCTAVWCSTVCP